MVAYLAWNGINAQTFGPGWLELSNYVAGLPFRRKFRRQLGKIKRYYQKKIGLTPAKIPLPYEAFGPILSDSEMVNVYSSSRISLNFSEVVDEITGKIKRHIRLRDFEIPMSGGLLFTGYQQELEEYYVVG
jgi:hypothetical protein